MNAGIHQLVSAFASPFAVVATLLVLMCVFFRSSIGRHHVANRLLLALGLMLYALSSPLVSVWATHSLERVYEPATLDQLRTADAIVVLSGGFRRGADNRGELAPDSISRCLRAVVVYRSIGTRPLVVSGGVLSTGPPGVPVSRGMKSLLVELGVAEADIVEEDGSTTTYENATGSWRLLAARGLKKVALVTSATHLPRAVAVFEGQGFDVLPVGSGYSNPASQRSVLDVIPNAASVDSINRVAHEWIGLAWYRALGRT